MTDQAKKNVVAEKEPQPLSEEEMEKITGGTESPGTPGSDQWNEYWDSYDNSGNYGE